MSKIEVMNHVLEFVIKNKVKNWHELEFENLFSYLCNYYGVKEPK